MTTTSTMTTTEPFRFDDRRNAVLALTAAAGWNLIDDELIRMEARGSTFTTGHRIRVREGDAEVTHVIFIDGGSPDRAGVVELTASDGERLCGWIYPRDPALPALSAVVNPTDAGTLLIRLGVDPVGATVELLTYRPGKRAVVRVRSADHTLYVKVVRPSSVNELVAEHRRWREHDLPAPPVVGWAPEGLIALGALPGVEAIHVVDAIHDSDAFLEALAQLCDRIAAVPADRPARASLTTRLPWYLARLRSLLPHDGARVADLGARIRDRLDRSPATPIATIHGDLHLGQIMVDAENPATIVGVLDIDTAGSGDPADDLGALHAHLVVTAELRSATPTSAQNARALADRWAASGRFDAIRSRAAAISATHFLGHALSGSLAADRALELAELVLSDESALTVGTGSSHPR